jgi:hypothetical protein
VGLEGVVIEGGEDGELGRGRMYPLSAFRGSEVIVVYPQLVYFKSVQGQSKIINCTSLLNFGLQIQQAMVHQVLSEVSK